MTKTHSESLNPFVQLDRASDWAAGDWRRIGGIVLTIILAIVGISARIVVETGGEPLAPSANPFHTFLLVSSYIPTTMLSAAMMVAVIAIIKRL
jgi:hypothetical protein